MAEGAHLATAATALPSIFEILAQDNLTQTLRPAFAHLFKVLAEVNIEHLEFLFRWRDEIYTGIELVLQHFCLKSCGASFAEQFYGLRRVPVNLSINQQCETGYKLPLSHHRRALLCLVAFPYLKLRLDSIFERLREDERRTSITKTKTDKLKQAFVYLYPLIHMSWEILVLGYLVRYALQRQQYSSPLYHLARTKLVTLAEDNDFANPLVVLWRDVRFIKRWTAIPRVLFRHVTRHYRELLTFALSLGSFFLQVLEWWYTAGQLVTNPVSLLRPPSGLHVLKSAQEKGMCPLCQSLRTNAAALSTSGYAFCYPCIYRYVRLHYSCPITRLPTTTANIVRLYSEQTT